MDKTPDDAILAESNDAAIRDRRRRAIIGISVAVFVLLLVLFMTWRFLQRPVVSDQIESADTVGIESSTAPGSSAVATDSGLSTVPPASATETGAVVSPDVPVGTEAATAPEATANYGGSTTTALAPSDTTLNKPSVNDASKSGSTTTKSSSSSSGSSSSASTSAKKVTYPNTVISAYPAAPNGSNGWYRVRPTIKFTPTGRTTWYRWGHSGSWHVYKGAMKAPVGTHTLQYYSRKPNGVLQARAQKYFAVDTSNPSNPQNLQVTGNSFKDVTLSWSASGDSYSGVARYEVFSADGRLRGSTSNTSLAVGGFAVGTSYAFKVRAVDRAGNLSGFSSYVFAPPSTLMYTNPPNPTGSNGWYRTAPAILFEANESGVTFWAWDAESSYSPYNGTFVMDRQGVHSLRYYTRNDKGISEVEQMATLKLDTLEPPGPAMPSIETSGPTTLKLRWPRVTDIMPGSGIEKYLVHDFPNEGPYKTYTVYPSGSSEESFTVSDPAGFTGRAFQITAVDAAGNTSSSGKQPASASSPAASASLASRKASASTKSAARTASPKAVTGVRTNYLRPTFADPTPGLVSTPISSPAPDPAGRAMIAGTCFDITPGGPFSGSATVVLNYNPANLQHSGSQIRMMHFTGGSWVEVTTEVDYAGHRVSGVTNSFSPFALFEDVPTVKAPASSWESLAVLGAFGLMMAAWSLRRRVAKARA